jgi:hypothetical protein
VKAELAGKRGICPECGAKFIVPSFSGERVAEDNGATTGSTFVVNPPATPSAVATATPPPLQHTPPVLAPVEAAAWYIRPASGGQFGPASDEVFAQWIAEGRVSVDSWVWRNGWADWRAGGDALREYGARVPAGPALAMAAAAAPPVNVAEAGPTVVVAAPLATTTDAAAQVDATSAEVRRAEIKRRKKKVRNLSIMLGVVALAMLAALVVVLAR